MDLGPAELCGSFGSGSATWHPRIVTFFWLMTIDINIIFQKVQEWLYLYLYYIYFKRGKQRNNFFWILFYFKISGSDPSAGQTPGRQTEPDEGGGGHSF